MISSKSSSLGQNPLDIKFREMDYDRHVQNVTEIVDGKRPRLANVNNPLYKDQFMNAKSGNIKFNEYSRQHMINTQNEAILCKLVEISQGRCCFLNSPEYSSVYQPASTQVQRPLKNLPFRQEQMRKIDEENKALAKRLYDQRSFINRDKLKKEIGDYEKLKKHMQKHKSTSSLAQKPLKLPPLIKNKFNQELLEQDNLRNSQLNQSRALGMTRHASQDNLSSLSTSKFEHNQSEMIKKSSDPSKKKSQRNHSQGIQQSTGQSEQEHSQQPEGNEQKQEINQTTQASNEREHKGKDTNTSAIQNQDDKQQKQSHVEPTHTDSNHALQQSEKKDSNSKNESTAVDPKSNAAEKIHTNSKEVSPEKQANKQVPVQPNNSNQAGATQGANSSTAPQTTQPNTQTQTTTQQNQQQTSNNATTSEQQEKKSAPQTNQPDQQNKDHK